MPAFNGNFASLFPGAYQVVQTDLGLTYGGTMLPTAGNTSTATMALSGTLTTAPVPIWIRLTGGGGTADIYYDGLGVTPAMSGVLVVATIPIVLTGAAAGLSITPSVGTLVNADTWKATCSALADQSGNGLHYAQAVATKQPVITAGLNGKVGLLFDGVDDFLQSTLVTAISYKIWAVLRTFAVGAQCTYFGPATAGVSGIVYSSTGSSATNVQQYNGSIANPGTFALNTPFRLESGFTNTTASYLRLGGGAPITGQNAGANVRADAQIAANLSAQFSRIEFFACAWMPAAVPTTAADSALNTSGGYGSGAISA